MLLIMRLQDISHNIYDSFKLQESSRGQGDALYVLHSHDKSVLRNYTCLKL